MEVRGVKIMSGTKAAELLGSKDNIDHKKAKLLVEFCLKAEACHYEYKQLSALRVEYNDIL